MPVRPEMRLTGFTIEAELGIPAYGSLEERYHQCLKEAERINAVLADMKSMAGACIRVVKARVRCCSGCGEPWETEEASTEPNQTLSGGPMMCASCGALVEKGA